MKEEIIIAGRGGQGVVVAGSLLANAAIEAELQTCGMVSYGVEMRGGAANATVTISDKKIGSPVIVHADTLIILSKEAMDKFEDSIKPGGIIIVDKDEVKRLPKRNDVSVIGINATEQATSLGNAKAANMVLLGRYLKERSILSPDFALKVLKTVLPRASDEVIDLNRLALLKGYGDENVH